MACIPTYLEKALSSRSPSPSSVNALASRDRGRVRRCDRQAFHPDHPGAPRDYCPGIGLRRSHFDREPVVGALGVDVGGAR